MRCKKCGSENPAGKRFCGDCGEPLGYRCSRCGSENPPGKKFCGDCGAALSVDSPARVSPSPTTIAEPKTTTETQRAAAPTQDSTTVDGERRHLTVLVGELVNSAEISVRLDPEEWREIAADYQTTAASTVTRFGGQGVKYLGDSLVVYFGYPEAREDDAERAVRAGIAIIQAVAGLNYRLAAKYGAKLSVRVGVHSGSVVVGHRAGKEADVFGDTPNIASRMLAVAAADSVLVTAAVEQLVAGRFALEDQGAQVLRGIERPVQLYRVVGPSVARGSMRNTAIRGRTTFVGREDEIGLALSRWESARDGEGQLVLVVGEPGIGKSRLVEEFRGRIKGDGHLWIECAGERFFESTPFHAVTRILDQGLGRQGDESQDERIERLERTLQLTGVKLNEALPLIAEMLELPVPEKYPPLMLAPDQRRKRLLVSIVSWILNRSRLQPVVIVVEDMQWVDPSSLELMQMLVEHGATAPLLLLYTARPEFRPFWPMRAHHFQITLSRLNDSDTREMIARVAARIALAKDVVDAVIQRTDGVPLFAEELTRLILERDWRSVAQEIPATLQDSLTARLDRLGGAKEVAQVAAVIGREFSYDLLQAVIALSEEELRASLERLADAELIYARGIPPEATYQFKHALIQDAAYQALLKSRRKDLHGRIARTIFEKFPAAAESKPEAIARHWTEAGEVEPALAAWKKAGESAYSRRAFKEAEDNLRRALAMLNALPEAPERDAKELAIVSTLVQALQLTGGYSASKTVEVSARARALAEKSGSLPQLVLQMHGTWAALLVSGEYRSAAALADQLLDLARQEGSHISFGLAHYAQLVARFYCGDLVGAEDHFASMSRFLHASGFKEFPGAIVICMGIAGVAAWMMGYAEKARTRIVQAVAFANDSRNPYDLAYGRYFEGALHWLLREPPLAEAAAAQALALSEEHGFPLVASLARTIIGWARARPGSTDEAISLIRQGIVGVTDAGGRVGISDLLTILAETQALGGLIEDALTTFEEALRTNPQEVVFRSNILKCRGELRLQLGQTELAEADFREAIVLAHGMSAKARELRATTSLARLLVKEGKSDEALAILAQVYGFFTEGLDTEDLRDAKALLAELQTSG
jgi:class 3 adenylate cyclase/tetratricopeptide (TPR) repeat protein